MDILLKLFIKFTLELSLFTFNYCKCQSDEAHSSLTNQCVNKKSISLPRFSSPSKLFSVISSSVSLSSLSSDDSEEDPLSDTKSLSNLISCSRSAS